MRRKRQNRGTWIPLLGHNEIIGGDSYLYSDFRFGTPAVPDNGGQGSVSTTAIALTPDFTLSQQAGLSTQLRDVVEGQAWTLQRIVGKIHATINVGVVGNWAGVIFTAGFLVARAEDQNQSQIELSQVEHDPQELNNAMNPWIWRRSWILGNPGNVGTVASRFPTTTAGYGSVADGPHIDSKSKRFIGREHRLWFVGSARGWSPDTIEPLDAGAIGVDGILDVRIYGGLRRQKNVSSF